MAAAGSMSEQPRQHDGRGSRGQRRRKRAQIARACADHEFEVAAAPTLT
jgi:hypothetical protein